MGATDSKHVLGQRVIAARNKLENDIKTQSVRANDIQTKAPKTIKVVMKSIKESFATCSPFLESILLVAWQFNPEECSKIVLSTCKRIFNAPINKNEYEWFVKYLFPSSIWMLKNKKNRFMYEELIDNVNSMQQGIVDSMNSIYSHLKSHPQWKQILSIQNQSIVERQDDAKVGLLKELEMKKNDQEPEDDLEAYMDSNLAVNILTTTAQKINKEFQNHIKTVMSHYGDFKAGPVKKVDRCVSKLENDYQDVAYPKSAKLLDLVRCAVTFNTVEQLVEGYNGLVKHIEKHSSIIELARVKNGFLNPNYSRGYRDIKINVIYHSSINPDISMICEVQLLLGQYLHEKKRIHKLYSIMREEEFFRMTVSGDDEKQAQQHSKDVADLTFEPVLNVQKQVKPHNVHVKVGKCSVDSSLGLLAVESLGKISCIDISNKKEIFSKDRGNTTFAHMHSHSWLVIDGEKHLAVQVSKNTVCFLKVKRDINSFVEVKELEICLDKRDEIYALEFDENAQHIIMVKNGNILEKRAVKNSNNVLISIKLEQKISQGTAKRLSLSNDGNWCLITCGNYKSYFYLIEIDKKAQHKIISGNLQATYCPCFINGEPDCCAIGSKDGKFEVWDLRKRVAIKFVKLKTNNFVSCLTSSNNILAVGSRDKQLSLWNVHTWKMFWSEQYQMEPVSVHLTQDLQYVTIGGEYGEKSLVLGIK